MSNDTSVPDQQPAVQRPGPGYASPQPPAVPGPAGPPPAAYGARPGPAPVPPAGPYAGQPAQPGQPVPPPGAYTGQPQPPASEEQQHWTPEGLVTTTVPVLPSERVAKGALLSLLAIPVGVLLSALIWKLGFVASLSGVVVAAGAAVLYARGSGGRVRKGIPVIVAVIVIGIGASFFAAVAVDLWDVFPQLDPEIASTYPGRGSFVANNLFYGPVLAGYTRDIVLFALFGVLGGFGTLLRLVRANASLQR